MLYFKIWYTDKIIQGTSFEDWKNAPDDGVLIVYENFGNGTGRVSTGSDWYWMLEDGNVYQSGTSSEIKGEYLPHNAPEGAILKKGKWTSDDNMQAVNDELLVELSKL